ncbi:MAG: potassium channel family protein, partial [Prochloraceae cyanobacterium]
QLLATIIILFIVTPAFGGTTGRIIISSIFSATIIAIIRTFNLQKREFLALLILAAASFALDVHNTLRPGMGQDKLFTLLVQTVYSLYILTALVTINRKIFGYKKVNPDTIKGGIAVFFLIGIFWALLYQIVYLLDPNAFSQPIEEIDAFNSMFYFSFTTLTTLGYGDISPVSDLARTLANLEAVVGVMYPAIYIARVVGLYTAQEMS